MRSAGIISVLMAAGAMASPVLEAATHHHHHHMDIHAHKARDVSARDNAADDLMNELNNVYGGTGWQPSSTASPPPTQPKPVVHMVTDVVTEEVIETVGGASTTTTVAPPPPPPAAPKPVEKEAIAVKPVQPAPVAVKPVQPAPVVVKPVQPSPVAPHVQEKEAQPAAQPTPAPSHPASSSDVSTGGLPTDFVQDLDTSDAIYKGLSLLHHNVHRQNHSASALVWNDTLADYAKTTAESCVYAHSLAPGNGGYGQNIAAGEAPGNITAALSNGFYNGELDLFAAAIGGQWGNDNPDMSNFEHWGHATQMLWEDTTSVGCYTSTCSPPGADALDCNPATGQSYLGNVGCGNGGTEAYFTVCNYYPPGNYAGEYSKVHAPGNMPSVAMTGNGVVGL